MYNKCIMIGNLVRDPEFKMAGSLELCKFTLAVNHRSSKENQETCFIDVVTWGASAKFASQYFKKGKMILVEGRLKQEEWEKDGKKFNKHIINADKVSFMSGSKDTSDEPMISESKRIFPSDIKTKISQQYELKNGQHEIGNNNLDVNDLPF